MANFAGTCTSDNKGLLLLLLLLLLYPKAPIDPKNLDYGFF